MRAEGTLVPFSFSWTGFFFHGCATFFLFSIILMAMARRHGRFVLFMFFDAALRSRRLLDPAADCLPRFAASLITSTDGRGAQSSPLFLFLLCS